MNPDDTMANRSDARKAQIIAAARDLYAVSYTHLTLPTT